MKTKEIEMFKNAISLAMPGLLVVASNGNPAPNGIQITKEVSDTFFRMMYALRSGLRPQLLGAFDEQVTNFTKYCISGTPPGADSKTVN